jgi:MarR family transcriptional regulator for hemolysin
MSVTEQAAPPREEQAPLSTNLGWLLSQAAHSLLTEQTARLESLGIVPRGYCVLVAAMAGEHTQTEIAQAVGLDKTTMVVTLDELEAAGLAERRPSETDRRARVVGVTAKGRRKAAQAEAVLAETQAEILATLPAGQRDALLEGLDTLVRGALAEPSACSRPVRKRG